MPGTTPVYGFPYPEPTDLVADYPALGQDLAEDIEAVLPTLGGLTSATPTTIANSAGTATLSDNTVTFTTVNSVSLNGCFTATSNNYAIIIRMSAASATNSYLNLRLRVAGVDAATAATYGSQVIDVNSTTVTGAANPNGNTNAVAGYVSSANAAYNSSHIIVSSPFLTTPTLFMSNHHNYTSTNHYWMASAAYHNQSTSYDGFTLYPNAGGTISGTVAVYGFRK